MKNVLSPNSDKTVITSDEPKASANAETFEIRCVWFPKARIECMADNFFLIEGHTLLALPLVVLYCCVILVPFSEVLSVDITNDWQENEKAITRTGKVTYFVRMIIVFCWPATSHLKEFHPLFYRY